MECAIFASRYSPASGPARDRGSLSFAVLYLLFKRTNSLSLTHSKFCFLQEKNKRHIIWRAHAQTLGRKKNVRRQHWKGAVPSPMRTCPPLVPVFCFWMWYALSTYHMSYDCDNMATEQQICSVGTHVLCNCGMIWAWSCPSHRRTHTLASPQVEYHTYC
jgi:hypothetical protein